MKKTAKLLLIVAVAVLLVGGGVFAGLNWNDWFGKEEEPQTSAEAELDTSVEDWTGEREVYTGEKNTDTIDIPGYGGITLKADTAEQTVNFYNPEQNTCYFRISLLLLSQEETQMQEDSSQPAQTASPDRTQLWQSGLIEPGKGIYSITLDETLPAGTYEDAILKYECFAMNEEQTPLNGSEIKLTLNVLE